MPFSSMFSSLISPSFGVVSIGNPFGRTLSDGNAWRRHLRLLPLRGRHTAAGICQLRGA